MILSIKRPLFGIAKQLSTRRFASSSVEIDLGNDIFQTHRKFLNTVPISSYHITGILYYLLNYLFTYRVYCTFISCNNNKRRSITLSYTNVYNEKNGNNM